MIKNIQEHHNAEEIEIIRLQNNIKQWKSELKFVSQEIEFYIDILDFLLIDKKNSDKKEAKYLYEQFCYLKQFNAKILKSCETFHPKLEEMNECEDIQCDHAYLNAHISLQLQIEKHIGDVRNIKIVAFTYLKNKIKNDIN